MQFDENKTLNDYEIKELKNYKQVLKRFFMYYSLDIYETQVICAYYGRLIKKENYPYSINSAFPVTIAAPLVRWSNVAKHMMNLDIGAFIDACKFSHAHLCKYKPKNPTEQYLNYNPYDF